MKTNTRPTSFDRKTVECPVVSSTLANVETYTETELAYLMWCAAVSHLNDAEIVAEAKASDLTATQPMEAFQG
jgi:hypothetical protein